MHSRNSATYSKALIIHKYAYIYFLPKDCDKKHMNRDFDSVANA